jgi:hypothetical protein
VGFWATPAYHFRQNDGSSPVDFNPSTVGISSQSNPSGTGNSLDATAFMSRTVSDEMIQVVNSFTTTDSHGGEISLAEYHIPGWTQGFYQLGQHHCHI